VEHRRGRISLRNLHRQNLRCSVERAHRRQVACWSCSGSTCARQLSLWHVTAVGAL